MPHNHVGFIRRDERITLNYDMFERYAYIFYLIQDRLLIFGGHDEKPGRLPNLYHNASLFPPLA